MFLLRNASINLQSTESGASGDNGEPVVKRVVRVLRNDTGDVTALAGGTEADTAEAVKSTRNHALSGSVKVVIFYIISIDFTFNQLN